MVEQSVLSIHWNFAAYRPPVSSVLLCASDEGLYLEICASFILIIFHCHVGYLFYDYMRFVNLIILSRSLETQNRIQQYFLERVFSRCTAILYWCIHTNDKHSLTRTTKGRQLCK